MRDLLFAVVFLTMIVSPAMAGAPLKGVDIKLGKNPGGKPAARITATGGSYSFSTGTGGGYDFRLVPPGTRAGPQLSNGSNCHRYHLPVFAEI